MEELLPPVRRQVLFLGMLTTEDWLRGRKINKLGLHTKPGKYLGPFLATNCEAHGQEPPFA